MNSRAQNGSDKTKLSLVEELALFALTRVCTYSPALSMGHGPLPSSTVSATASYLGAVLRKEPYHSPKFSYASQV